MCLMLKAWDSRHVEKYRGMKSLYCYNNFQNLRLYFKDISCHCEHFFNFSFQEFSEEAKFEEAELEEDFEDILRQMNFYLRPVLEPICQSLG